MRTNLAAVGLLALALVACGGPRRCAADGPPERAAPVAMADTPRPLLQLCRGNRLVRPICPARIPASGAAAAGRLPRELSCTDPSRHELIFNGRIAPFTHAHCIDATWGVELGTLVPGYIAGTGRTLSGWNGKRWAPIAGESLLFPPPLHVHVSIEAGVGSAFVGMAAPGAVSLGRVRWYGTRGRLVLNPPYPEGGPAGGHLVFSFAAGRVNYAISLHSWMAAIRLQGKGVDRVFRAQPGPALPHVVATLKAIVGSALRSDRVAAAAAP